MLKLKSRENQQFLCTGSVLCVKTSERLVNFAFWFRSTHCIKPIQYVYIWIAHFMFKIMCYYLGLTFILISNNTTNIKPYLRRRKKGLHKLCFFFERQRQNLRQKIYILNKHEIFFPIQKKTHL